jgi:hypothetical protein
MSRQRKKEVQLSLDLYAPIPKVAEAIERRNVISFVDSATQAIRKSAIQRVIASKIFAYPSRPKNGTDY